MMRRAALRYVGALAFVYALLLLLRWAWGR